MATTSTTPFPRYKSTDLTKFAHLFKRDAELWRRFLVSTIAQGYTAFDYDIKVGQFAVAAIKFPTPSNLLQAGTLAKRIDVVGFLPSGKVDLFEVKPASVAAALGQLLLYSDLFESTFPELPINRLVLITESIDTESLNFAKKNFIFVYQV